MHDNPLYRLQAKEAKADAYILKSQLKSNLALLLNNHQEKKVNEGDKNIFTV
jgi:hypothetical protein